MINVGIIGSTGYTAGELIRLLVHHEKVNISYLFSHSQAGKKVTDVHQDIFQLKEQFFTSEIGSADVVFLCLGHGKSKSFLEKNPELLEAKIIDLSHDFRLTGKHSFSYGLSELDNKISHHIANPGCFATAIQLALLPLAKHQLLAENIHITAITGATGAGGSLSPTSHFPHRSNNVSAYKVFEHQHLAEINQTLSSFQQQAFDIHFVPIRGDFSRGIFASISLEINPELETIIKHYENYYSSSSFVHIQENPVHLKQVVNTNNCAISLLKKGNMLHITSVIDNLLKGASGQAIQNMNRMFNLPESTGLNLKASAF